MTSQTAQIAKDFSRHNYENTYPYLMDTIQWHLIGGESLKGKENIMNACSQSATYLRSVTTKFSKFKVMVSDDCVVVDTTADYIDSENKSTTIYSCDIYSFIDGKVAEITSYCIEKK